MRKRSWLGLFVILFLIGSSSALPARADRSPDDPPPAPVPVPSPEKVQPIGTIELVYEDPQELPLEHRLRVARELFEASKADASGYQNGFVLMSDIRRGQFVGKDGKQKEVLYIRADAPVFRSLSPGMPAVPVACAVGVWFLDFGPNGHKFEWPGPRTFYVSSDGRQRPAAGIEEYVVSKYQKLTMTVGELLSPR